MTVEKWIWNAELPYNEDTQNNDIIILKLKSHLFLNDNVQPACLPSTDWAPETDSNNRCFVSGWGTLKSGLFYSCTMYIHTVNSRIQDKNFPFFLCLITKRILYKNFTVFLHLVLLL